MKHALTSSIDLKTRSGDYFCVRRLVLKEALSLEIFLTHQVAVIANCRETMRWSVNCLITLSHDWVDPKLTI